MSSHLSLIRTLGGYGLLGLNLGAVSLALALPVQSLHSVATTPSAVSAPVQQHQQQMQFQQNQFQQQRQQQLSSQLQQNALQQKMNQQNAARLQALSTDRRSAQQAADAQQRSYEANQRALLQRYQTEETIRNTPPRDSSHPGHPGPG